MEEPYLGIKWKDLSSEQQREKYVYWSHLGRAARDAAAARRKAERAKKERPEPLKELEGIAANGWEAPPRRIKDRQDWAARLLACGKSKADVARLLGCDASLPTKWTQDAQFTALVDHYQEMNRAVLAKREGEIFGEVERLGLNALKRLNARYEEDPKSITHNAARSDAEFAVDRLGYGKVNKSVNVSVVAQPLAALLEERKRRADVLEGELAKEVDDERKAIRALSLGDSND